MRAIEMTSIQTQAPREAAPEPIPIETLIGELELDLGDAEPMRIRKTESRSAERVIPFSGEMAVAIQQGDRNATLASIAGRMRRSGMSQAEIDVSLQEINLRRCVEPLGEAEVERIATSICRYPAAENAGEPLTDVGNAARFARTWNQDVRYVPKWNKWLIWSGAHWKEDSNNEIMERAKGVACSIAEEAPVEQDPKLSAALRKHSIKSQSAPRLHALIELAQSIPALTVEHSALDANRNLLGVRNGTIDLCSGRRRESHREDLIARVAPVEYQEDADCPTFRRFLNEIFENTPAFDKKYGGQQQREEQAQALIDYVQRVVGYAISGLTTEQCLFFMHGSGANGKTTLLNVILALLGPDLARQTPCDTIMARYGARAATNDLARLHSTRVVITNEVEDNQHFDESQLKLMTGQDRVTARFLYQEYFEFTPQFKLFVAGNHKPVIRNNDEGIWRRIHLIPFLVTIPPVQRDPTLPEKLRAEMPGILNWALCGHSTWRRQGLLPPPSVAQAVKDYREEMDLIGLWISESCDLLPSRSIKAQQAYGSYRFWCEGQGQRPMSGAAFGRKLGERFSKRRTNEGILYQGLALKQPRIGPAPPNPCRGV